MRIPQGFSRQGETRVCQLKKSLYGLRQASRNWYQKFTKALLEQGFKRSYADHSLFVYKWDGVHVASLIHVDDIIIVGNNGTKYKTQKSFLIKDSTSKTWVN